MSRHEWCRDTARDEAVRAAEDAAAVPSIQHRDLPEQVSLLWASLTDILGRVVRLEAEMDAGQAEEAAPAVCAPASPVEGFRTERVTLEITQAAKTYVAPSGLIWTRCLGSHPQPGESVRVVHEADTVSDESVAHGVTLRLVETRKSFAAANRGIARLANEREASQAERDAARADAEHDVREVLALARQERDAARAECERLQARVAEFWRESMRLRDRVAELEAAPAAGGEAKQEPEPRGWLTAEERSLVESLRETFQQNADGLRSAGSVGHAENWERRVRILDAILVRETPPRVRRPKLQDHLLPQAQRDRDDVWIAAIREAGGEVADG